MFYHCGICNVNFNSQAELTDHFMGPVHETHSGLKGKNRSSKDEGDIKFPPAQGNSTLNYDRNNSTMHFAGNNSSGTGSVQYQYQGQSEGDYNYNQQYNYFQHQDQYGNGNNQNYCGGEGGDFNFYNNGNQPGNNWSQSWSQGGRNQLQAPLDQYDCDSELYPREPSDTDKYCTSCRIALSSPMVAQLHYGGSKHQYKVRLLRVAKQTILQEGIGNTCFANPQTFCMTCRIVLTSKSMADNHYAGAKHRRKVKQLEEEAKKAQAGEEVGKDDLFGPLEKKKKPNDGENLGDKNEKIMELSQCPVCNVQLTSSTMAQQHYSGAKHKNKVKLLEQGQGKNETGNNSEISEKMEDLQKLKNFINKPNPKLAFCEVCDVQISPKILDVHKNGAKHKRKLQALGKAKENKEDSNKDQTENKEIEAAADLNMSTTKPRKAASVKKSSDFKQYMCEICRVEITSKDMEDQHYNGAKHKNKVKLLEAQKSGSTQIAGKAAKMFDFCEVCNVNLSSEAMATLHNMGAKHKRNAKLLQVMDAKHKLIQENSDKQSPPVAGVTSEFKVTAETHVPSVAQEAFTVPPTQQ